MENKIKKKLGSKKLKNTIIIIELVVIFVSLSLWYLSKNYGINVTPSVPLGIYKINRNIDVNEIKKGDIIVYKLPIDYQKLTTLKSDEVLSLKKIVAVYGDKIEIKNSKIYINEDNYGNIINNNKFPKFDGKLAKDEVLTLSKVEKSFDGRYYGGIKKSKIIGKAELIYEFKLDSGNKKNK